MDDMALFDSGVDPDLPEPQTRGERRRQRIDAVIARGQHPLALALGTPLPLHASVVRDNLEAGPCCGGCVFRQVTKHNAGAYPKCLVAPVERTRRSPYDGKVYVWDEYPRVSHGEATDVRAWWPACHDYQSEEKNDGR